MVGYGGNVSEHIIIYDIIRMEKEEGKLCQLRETRRFNIFSFAAPSLESHWL